jgi:hypothetical protein
MPQVNQSLSNSVLRASGYGFELSLVKAERHQAFSGSGGKLSSRSLPKKRGFSITNSINDLK